MDFIAVRNPAQNLHLDSASQVIVILKNPNRNAVVATLGTMKVQLAQSSIHPLRIMGRLSQFEIPVQKHTDDLANPVTTCTFMCMFCAAGAR